MHNLPNVCRWSGFGKDVRVPQKIPILVWRWTQNTLHGLFSLSPQIFSARPVPPPLKTFFRGLFLLPQLLLAACSPSPQLPFVWPVPRPPNYLLRGPLLQFFVVGFLNSFFDCCARTLRIQNSGERRFLDNCGKN